MRCCAVYSVLEWQKSNMGSLESQRNIILNRTNIYRLRYPSLRLRIVSPFHNIFQFVEKNLTIIKTSLDDFMNELLTQIVLVRTGG
jgi:hypothetical protein